MILKFFKPAYYSKCNDVDEIMGFLSMISDYVIDKEYSPIINKVMIGPIIAPEEVISSGLWRDKVIRCWPKSHDASVSLHIDYNEFTNSSYENKQIMLVINLLNSIKVLEFKGKFDYITFKNDVMEFCKRYNYKYIIKAIEKI